MSMCFVIKQITITHISLIIANYALEKTAICIPQIIISKI